MPTPSYDLSRLDPNSFEHMVNMVALKVLGAGHSSFGPGPDGGRDGYFEGKAPYPSTSRGWSGRWYIQSKFLRPNIGTNPQKWLLDRLKEELAEFEKPDTRRTWPNNWIIATNVDPSGKPETGAFDQARKLVAAARPQLARRFHIWGGRKILDLLGQHPDVANYYADFVTPGHVLTRLYEQIGDSYAHIKDVIRYFTVTELVDQQFTKLEQAGSNTDSRPGIQRLFTDLPFSAPLTSRGGMAATDLARTAAQNHRISHSTGDDTLWRPWYLDPGRARVWFVKGGPGQGKSTLTQYICQIQRAALIVDFNGVTLTAQQRATAREIREYAMRQGLWPIAPRIPVTIELKELAQWYGRRKDDESKRVLAFLVERLTAALAQEVLAGTLKRAFETSRWLFVFDGLDEVPGDAKDAIAAEVCHFVNDMLVGCSADALVVCTSRPQGYSGQFNALEAAVVQLSPLSRSQALACARPVLEIDRSESDANSYFELLSSAMGSPAIKEIMTTPLQCHIMAVVVRDGGRPPERKWQLFANFYQTIKRRKANRNLPDRRIAGLLREEDQLIKSLHTRLGFELHARAETSNNAVASLDRIKLKCIVKEVVEELKERDVESTIDLLMEATTERLVLVNTPEAGSEVRFDIRPLQESFAAEYIYESGETGILAERLGVVAGR